MSPLLTAKPIPVTTALSQTGEGRLAAGNG
jgi:hypothetical protein